MNGKITRQSQNRQLFSPAPIPCTFDVSSLCTFGCHVGRPCEWISSLLRRRQRSSFLHCSNTALNDAYLQPVEGEGDLFVESSCLPGRISHLEVPCGFCYQLSSIYEIFQRLNYLYQALWVFHPRSATTLPSSTSFRRSRNMHKAH